MNKSVGFKEFIQSNLPWLIAGVLSLVNVYITATLAPLKQDITVLAEDVAQVKEAQTDTDKNGTVSDKLNTLRIDGVEENIVEIKQGILRVEDKLDQLK